MLQVNPVAAQIARSVVTDEVQPEDDLPIISADLARCGDCGQSLTPGRRRPIGPDSAWQQLVASIGGRRVAPLAGRAGARRAWPITAPRRAVTAGTPARDAGHHAGWRGPRPRRGGRRPRG